MKLNPQIQLAFNGQCEAAFNVYARCLNGDIAFMLTWGNSPMKADAPPGWDAKVFHATLKIGNAVITGTDVAPGTYEQPKGFEIVLQMDDAVAAERVFQALTPPEASQPDPRAPREAPAPRTRRSP
jgi:PhnB protein